MGREPVKCQRSRIYLELTFTLDAFKFSCKVLFNFEEKSPTGFCRRENSGYLSSIDRMEEVPLPSSDWWRGKGIFQDIIFQKVYSRVHCLKRIWNLSLHTCWLCDFEQITLPRWAFLFSSVKWGCWLMISKIPPSSKIVILESGSFNSSQLSGAIN